MMQLFKRLITSLPCFNNLSFNNVIFLSREARDYMGTQQDTSTIRQKDTLFGDLLKLRQACCHPQVRTTTAYYYTPLIGYV